MDNQANKKSVEVLLISDFFPPEVNAGSESIALELSKGYSREGFNVSVITTSHRVKKYKVIESFFGDLKVYTVGYQTNNRYSSIRSLLNLRILRILRSFLDANSFDLVHLHNIHQIFSFSAISEVKKKKIPSIITMHDAMAVYPGKYVNYGSSYKVSNLDLIRENYKRYIPFKNFFVRKLLSSVDRIITVSKELEIFLNVNNISNTTTIHNGIRGIEKINAKDRNEFRKRYDLSSEDKILCLAGRLSDKKGLSQSIKLLNKLNDTDSKFRLLLAGELPRNFNVSNPNIVTAGWLSKEDLNIAYSLSSFTLVLSTYLDPFPTVILESLRAGTPIIVSKLSGGKEAVSDKTGFIVNPYNPELIAEKINIFISKKENVHNFRKCCKEAFIEKFDANIFVKKYIKIFNDIKNEKKY